LIDRDQARQLAGHFPAMTTILNNTGLNTSSLNTTSFKTVIPAKAGIHADYPK
jgi:hypothetical protein